VKNRRIMVSRAPAQTGTAFLQDLEDQTMKNDVGKYLRKLRNTKNALLISMLIGSLIGAAVALLFAPQSGAQTRAQIHEMSIQSRDRKQMDRLSAALEAGKMPVEVAPEA
jgi:predicted acylesterase/phospholipase RssA